MLASSVEFLSPERARQMAELAERARATLAGFSEQRIGYDATALQLLDEWVERVSSPPHTLRVLWIAFLGEVFRRRHGGEWVLGSGDSGRLAVLCPTESGGVRWIAVATQVDRRIANGLPDSLALFYLRESILLKQPTDL